MYAILHLPTGYFLEAKRAANTVLLRFTPFITNEKSFYKFYSKQDAEKYKRNFLVALYSMRPDPTLGSPLIYSKPLPKFLKKRNKKITYHMQEHAILTGLASLQYYPIITDPNTSKIKVSSANEFLVVKV